MWQLVWGTPQMALPDLKLSDVGTQTTRRTVVKTGVKLAYAAPLVGASMKLGDHSASAVSTFTCPPNLVCGVVQAPCGSDVSGVCSSVRGVEATSCICGNDVCGPACSTDADCQSHAPGSICQAPGTGCCGQACIAPCHAFDAGAGSDSLTGSNSGQ